MLFWAGDQGDGWDVFCQDLAELGIGGGVQEATAPCPFVAANPVRGNLAVALASGGPDYTATLRIYDIAGRAVMENDLHLPAGSTASIDCSRLPPGVYMVHFGQGIPPDRFILVR
jgi:hypothetical protein